MSSSPSPPSSSPPVPFNDLKAPYVRRRQAIDDAVARVLVSGYYIGGPEVEAFEAELAAHLGLPHAVAVANGTDAIALCLRALGISRDDEVIVPALSAYPTTVGVFQGGAVPVFVDVDATSGLIDPALVEAAITPRTRVIMPVHLYGNMANVRALERIARARDLILVEDCAQAIGARASGGEAPGQLAAAAAWSFYPTKNLGALGDAGAVTTRSPELAARLRRIRNYGQVTRYEHAEMGFNSRLDPLQAAILRAGLPELAAENLRRREIGARYDQAFAQQAVVRPLTPPPGSLPNRHLYPVLLPDRQARRDFQAALEGDGVQTLIHYPIPMPDQTATPEAWRPARPCDRARQLCDRVVSLPLYPDLIDAQVTRVIEAVRRWAAAR